MNRPHSSYKPQSKYNPSSTYSKQPPFPSSSDFAWILKQGFDQQSNLLRQLIVTIESMAETQNKYLQNISRYTKQSSINQKTNQVQSSHRQQESEDRMSPMMFEKRERSQLEEQRRENVNGKKQVRKIKVDSSAFIRNTESKKLLLENGKKQKLKDDEVEEIIQFSSPRDQIAEIPVGEKPKPKQKPESKPKSILMVKASEPKISPLHAQIISTINSTKQLKQVQQSKVRCVRTQQQIPNDNLFQKRTNKNQLDESTTYELQIDYKDKLFYIELLLTANEINSLSIIHEQISPTKKSSNFAQSIFKKVKTLEVEKQEPIPQQSQQSHQQLQKRKQSFSSTQLLESKFKAWIAELMNKLCKSSFYGFFSKQMSEKETKVYFSKNYIYNYIRSREYIRSCSNGFQIEKIFLQLFEKESKSCLKFLKLKYPQQQKAYIDEKIYNMIPQLDLSLDYQSYVINSLGFKQKTFDWRQIKLFINSLIKQTNEKEKFFKQNFNNLFKDRQGNFLPGLSFAVNTKIKPNTPTYTSQEIEQHGLIIKSPQIMRIVIKWIEYLEELINDVSNNKKSSEWFSSPGARYREETWDDSIKRTIIDLLKNNSRFNEETKMFEPLKEQSNAQNMIIRNFSKRVIDIMNEYKSKFQIVPNEEADIGIFTSVMSSTIQSLASEHLHYLLNKLQTIVDKPYEKSIIFPIFDLFRGKCSGSFRQIDRVYENIVERKEELEVIKVKNRLNTSNKDFLINLIMQGTSFVCELQLHIQDSSNKAEDEKIVSKSSCSNSFNHFLYELQRSKYGPLSQSVTIFESQDDIASFFSLPELQKFSKEKTKINFNRSVIVTDDYKLKIVGDDEFKMLTNQSMDIFCNCCLKIYKSYSFFMPFAMKDSDGTTICSSCLMLKLDKDDVKKLVLRSYHSFFQSVSSDRELNQLKSDYIVIANIQERQISLYKKSIRMYLSSMLEVLQEKNIKRIKVSKAMFQNSFVYALTNSSLLIQRVIGVDYVQDLLQKKMMETFYKPKYFGYTMLYLKTQAEPALVIDVFSASYSQIADRQSQISELVTQIEGQAKLKSGNWKLKLSRKINNLFEYIPESISNTIYNLTMTNIEKLNRTPKLKMKSLRNLSISLSCRWADIDFKFLETPKIEVLKIVLGDYQDLIDVRRIPFVHLQELEIHANEEVDHFKFENVEDKVDEWFEEDFQERGRMRQDLRNSGMKQMTPTNKSYFSKKPSINQSPLSRRQDFMNQNKQFKEGTAPPMRRQKKIPLDKLETLWIKFGSEAGLVSFNGLNHPNLTYINIQQDHKDKSVINLIDFSNVNLLKLQNLQISTQEDQQIRELKGFDSPQTQANTPSLEVFSIESHCYSTNLQFLNSKTLKQYSCRQWNSCQESHNMIHPLMDFEKLEELTVESSNFPFERILYPEKLQILNLYNVNGCNEVIESYSSLLKSLQELTLEDSKSMGDLNLVQEIKSLEKLSITGFNSVHIEIQLPSLTYLEINKTKLVELDLRSIQSQQLQVLKILDNDSLQVIKMRAAEQVFNLKNLDLDNPKMKDKFFEGVQFSKKQFWALREMFWDGKRISQKEWWNKWNKIKVVKVEDGQLVFDQ